MLKYGDSEVLSIGADLVTTGDFAADSDWTKGAGWTIAAGKATHAAGNVAALEQNVGALASRPYSVTFTVSNRTAGSVTPYIGGKAGTVRSSNATFTETITTTGTGNLQFVPSTDFDGSIDDVTVECLSVGFSPTKLLPTSGVYSGKKCVEILLQNIGAGAAVYMSLNGEPPADVDPIELSDLAIYTAIGYSDITNLRFAKKTAAVSVRGWFRYLC